jgi:hypothetical protein
MGVVLREKLCCKACGKQDRKRQSDAKHKARARKDLGGQTDKQTDEQKRCADGQKSPGISEIGKQQKCKRDQRHDRFAMSGRAKGQKGECKGKKQKQKYRA